jgi:hypothetical protein
MSYFKVWAGKKSAMNELHGNWEESFSMLRRFKAALEEICPGSIVEIDCKKINGRMHFQGCLCALEHVLTDFWLGADHILVLIPLISLVSIMDNWLLLLPLMDITGCIQLHMVFLGKKIMPIGHGS